MIRSSSTQENTIERQVQGSTFSRSEEYGGKNWLKFLYYQCTVIFHASFTAGINRVHFKNEDKKQVKIM